MQQNSVNLIQYKTTFEISWSVFTNNTVTIQDTSVDMFNIKRACADVRE